MQSQIMQGIVKIKAGQESKTLRKKGLTMISHLNTTKKDVSTIKKDDTKLSVKQAEVNLSQVE